MLHANKEHTGTSYKLIRNSMISHDVFLNSAETFSGFHRLFLQLQHATSGPCK